MNSYINKYLNNVSDFNSGLSATEGDYEDFLFSKLKIFYDNSSTGMYITSRKGGFLDVNEVMTRLFGFTKDEFKEKTVMSIYFSVTDRIKFKHMVETRGSIKDYKIKLRRKDNTPVDCLIDAVPWKDDKNEFGGYIGTIKPANNSVVRTIEDDRYALAIRGSNEGLWEWNTRRGIVHFTGRWKNIIGYEENEIKNNMEEWFSRIHPEDLQGVKTKLSFYLNKKISNFTAYYRIKHKTGNYIWAVTRAIAEFDSTGKVSRIAGSMGNISSHIKAIESFKKKENELNALNYRLNHEKDMLSRYFSDDMIDQIMTRDKENLKNQETEAAILYMKIHNSSSIIEEIGSSKFAEVINEIIIDAMDLVYGNKGSVNRIEGDGLLITFGCPVSSVDDLHNALQCSLEIRNYLNTYNDVRPSFLSRPIKIGIGLSYGKVFSGSIGSVRRLDYTVVGKPVNKSRSLQAFSESSKFDILIDESIANRLEIRTKMDLTTVNIYNNNNEPLFYFKGWK